MRAIGYKDQVLADTPRAYWRLGEPSGTSAFDETANNLDATYVGTVTKVQPSLLVKDTDTAVRIANTVDSLINRVDLPALGSFGTAYTLEIWAKPHSDGIIFSMGLPFLQAASGLAQFSWLDGGAVQRTLSAGSVPLESIAHIVGTHDGTTGRLYVNGLLVASGVFSTNAPSGSGGRIGVHNNTSGTEGDSTLDEAAVYLYALSPSQVYQHYLMGSAGPPALLVNTEFVHLLEFQFSSGTVRLSTGAQDLSWNSFTWEGVGGLLELSPIEETSDAQAQGVDVKLSGVDQTILAVLLGTNYRGRSVKIWRAYLDRQTGIIATTPIILFKGLQLGTYTVEENRDSGGGTVTISTRLSGYFGVSRIRGIVTNVASHQRFYPGDMFFEKVAKLANVKIYWGNSFPSSTGITFWGAIHGQRPGRLNV